MFGKICVFERNFIGPNIFIEEVNCCLALCVSSHACFFPRAARRESLQKLIDKEGPIMVCDSLPPGLDTVDTVPTHPDEMNALADRLTKTAEFEEPDLEPSQPDATLILNRSTVCFSKQGCWC